MQSDGTAAADDDDFRPELRLHQSSWLFAAANYLKAFLVPMVLALVVGADRDFGAWGPAVVVVPLIAAGLWQQWVYRYGFSSRGLVIHEGLFFRNVRTIDYQRIENVDTERGLLHRVFGVAEVRVETSTGGSAEARIRVLDLDAVEDMRSRIFAQRRPIVDTTGEQPAAADDAEETLLALPPGELVLFGLIDNRGLLVVAAVLGVLGQGGFFENMEDWAGPLFARLPWEDFAGFSRLVQVMLAVATAVALIAATRVLSILIAFAMLYDFRLTGVAGDLHTRYGLLTRIAMTLRRRRIQAVHQTSTLLHRLFGRVSLRVDLAGGLTAAAQAQQAGGQANWRELWLAPLCRADDAERLIRAALPQVHLTGLDWQGLAPNARWRIFRVSAAVWLLVASVPAVWWTGWWSLVILAAPLALFWMHASLYVKYTGWALHDEFFVLKRGWLTRKIAVAPRNRLQSVHLRESPFDRRNRMAQLNVDIAGATSASHRFAISYLRREQAGDLAAALYGSRLTDQNLPERPPAG